MAVTIDGYPRWARVRQRFPGEPVADIPAAVAAALAELRAGERVKPGDKVGITAGSRGIVNIVAVTAAAVAELKRLGAVPFVFPAMGSHGDANPEGQLAVLTSYGITESAVGAPVLSRPELASLGETKTGIPLWCDALAYGADHLVVVNRVKPHTDFSGMIESGPTKMLAIGVGKHTGASDCHRRFVERGYEEVIREVGDALWDRLPVLGGIGLVENGHEQTVAIGAVRPDSHEADEAALQERAKEVFGSLPVDFLHVLIVDEIGKNISGSGMDPNVTGTDCCRTHRPPEKPTIRRIVIRGLTEESHGNAAGIGNGDFVLQRCVDAVDWHATAVNVVTAASPEGGRCPLVYATDRDLLAACFLTTGELPPDQLRLIRIRNTLLVDDFLASEPLLPGLRRHPRCEVASDPEPMRFSDDGILL